MDLEIRCSPLSNACPSKSNCHRHTPAPKGEIATFGALDNRRDAGSSACDQWEPIKLVTTYTGEV